MAVSTIVRPVIWGRLADAVGAKAVDASAADVEEAGGTEADVSEAGASQGRLSTKTGVTPGPDPRVTISIGGPASDGEPASGD